MFTASSLFPDLSMTHFFVNLHMCQSAMRIWFLESEFPVSFYTDFPAPLAPEPCCLFCRTNRGPSFRGAEIPNRKVGLGGWLWKQICQLHLGWSSRVPAAGSEFDPLISHGSPDEIEISCLTRPRTSGGDFKRPHVILSRLKKVPENR